MRGSTSTEFVAGLAVSLTLACGATWVHAADSKPKLLVVWGDDIGQSNISTYTHGMVGYETPSIKRIANEGMSFTDYYAEQSCTSGCGPLSVE